MQIRRNCSTLRLDILLDGFRCTLANLRTIRQVHTTHTGLCRKFNKFRSCGFLALVTQMACQFKCRLAFRRIIMQAGQSCTANQFAAACTANREKVSRQTVAVSNGARFIQDHGIDIAASLNGLTGHCDHIKARNAIHTSNTDCRQQAANRGRDQTNCQRDQG